MYKTYVTIRIMQEVKSLIGSLGRVTEELKAEGSIYMM